MYSSHSSLGYEQQQPLYKTGRRFESQSEDKCYRNCAFVVHGKEGKAMRLTNAESGAVSSSERMTFKLKREILSQEK